MRKNWPAWPTWSLWAWSIRWPPTAIGWPPNCTVSYASHIALLGRIDAAVIAAPTVLHHRLAVDCLEAGTHLLVEKPICTTVAEADELVELARRQQLVLQVGHVERFNPALVAAIPYARNPKFIEAVRASGFTFRSMDVGVVLDLMIHDIDLVLSLVRSPLRSVEALGVSILGGHEDVAHARLEFQSGCVANLSASRVSYEPARKMQIWAPRAYANIDFGTRTTTLVRPSETLLRGEFQADRLTPEQVEHYKTHLAEEHLPRAATDVRGRRRPGPGTRGLCRQHSFRPATAGERRGRPRRPGRGRADSAQHRQPRLGSCLAAGDRSRGGSLSADRPCAANARRDEGSSAMDIGPISRIASDRSCALWLARPHARSRSSNINSAANIASEL